MSHPKRILSGLAALFIAGFICPPSPHSPSASPASRFHQPAGLSPKAKQLAARHLQLWQEPQSRDRELKKMRASNAEWDFMGRSFLVWSLANMGLRAPAAKQSCLQTMDQIIDETLRLEKQEGMYFFLMPYAKNGRYVTQ